MAVARARRPAPLRPSRSRPSNGATTAKGATVSRRYRATRGRAAATGTAKNRVPARATATRASPRVLTAWTQARRSSGREGRDARARASADLPSATPSMTGMLTAKPPGIPGASPIPGVGQLGRLLLAGQLGRGDVHVGGLVQRAEGDLAVLGVDHDHLAGGELLPQELLGQRVLDHPLDGPAQRPGPQGGVVALLGQQV